MSKHKLFNKLFDEITNDLSNIIDLKLKSRYGNNNSILLYADFLNSSSVRLELSNFGKYNTLDIFTYSSKIVDSKNIVSVEYYKDKINKHLFPFYTEEEFFIESLENNLVFKYEQYLNLINYISNFKKENTVLYLEFHLKELGCTGVNYI